nr:cyclic nucleotide-gated ion channel 1-like [Quercus suber]
MNNSPNYVCWRSPDCLIDTKEEHFPAKNGLHSQEKALLKILHPQNLFLCWWNKIFVVLCVIAVSLDPLFFYIPVTSEDNKCVRLDKKLRTTAIVLRSISDIIHIVHMILQFRTGFIDEASQKLGKPLLVKDARTIARRYFWPYFLIDILVILPIPQVVVSVIFSARGAKYLNTRKLMNFILLFQYVPRVLRIYLSWRELMKSARKFAKTPAWVKGLFNFFLYVLASHVLGAFWYFFSIQREMACWDIACENHPRCVHSSLNCDHSLGNYTFLNDFCPIKTPNTTLFDFGIYLEALQSGVAESTDFPQKFIQCFWWGLQNLNSLGQNLQTSNYIWEGCFAIFISIVGLLLFLYLIGNVQTYMQLATTRSEEIRRKMTLKEIDIELWISKNDLPQNINEEIMQSVKDILEGDKDANVESLLLNVRKKSNIKRHLCLDMLKRVPRFRNINNQLLQVFLDHLKPVQQSECSYIFREGEPLDAMLFVTQGIAWTYTSSDGNKSECLGKGQFCGEEILEWGFKALSLTDLSNLPISPKTVRCHTKVEAFALRASDLKTILTQNWWLLSKMLSHITGSNLERWKPLAASSILAAWRRSPRYRAWQRSHRHHEDVLIKSAQWLTGRELTKIV